MGLYWAQPERHYSHTSSLYFFVLCTTLYLVTETDNNIASLKAVLWLRLLGAGRRRLVVESRVFAQVSRRGICGGKNGTESSFYRSPQFFPVNNIPPGRTCKLIVNYPSKMTGNPKQFTRIVISMIWQVPRSRFATQTVITTHTFKYPMRPKIPYLQTFTN
jgi:hypothetical protein